MERHMLRVCILFTIQIFVADGQSVVAQTQFESNPQVFAIPVSTHQLRVDQYTGSVFKRAHSGIFMQVNVHDFDEPVNNVFAKLKDRPSPERTLFELIQAIMNDDYDQFVELSNPDSREDPLDPVANSYNTYRILFKDVNNPQLVRRFSIGDLDYFELHTQGRFPAIPFIIMRRGQSYYLSWSHMGHSVIQVISSIITAHRNEPGKFQPLGNIQSTKWFMMPKPFGSTDNNPVKIFVNARNCNYPIFGNDATPRLLADEDNELLTFYKSSCEAFKTKDFQSYLASFTSEGSAFKQSTIDRASKKGWLDEIIKSRTEFRKIAAVVHSDELFILFPQRTKGKDYPMSISVGNFECIIRTKNGFKRLAKEGPLNGLLKWPPFAKRFIDTVINNGQPDVPMP